MKHMKLFISNIHGFPVKKALIGVSILIVTSLIVIQLVPYGRDHHNPPVRMEPAWDSEQSRTLAVRACYACHSNETEWPWYSNIAPVSWLIQNHVIEGRNELNFSEWNLPQKEKEEKEEIWSDLIEVLQDGEMPPRIYTLFNSTAKLSATEKDLLTKEFEAMFGSQKKE